MARNSSYIHLYFVDDNTLSIIVDLAVFLIYQSLFTNTLVEHAYTEMHDLKNKHGVKKTTVMPKVYNVSYNNRVHGQKLRLNIIFFNRISRSSLGSLKPTETSAAVFYNSNTQCLKQLHQETSNSEVE